MVTFIEIVGIAFLLSFIPMAFLFVSEHRRARRPRLVACPETQTPELLSLDAAGAASSADRSDEELVLVSCTRWPERALCARGCLEGVESETDECRRDEERSNGRGIAC